MPQLTIIYDDFDPPLQFAAPDPRHVKIATMPIADGPNLDIYTTARKIAELLLEQLEKNDAR